MHLNDVRSTPRIPASAVDPLAAGLQDFSLYCRDPPSGPVAPDPKDSYLLAMIEASQVDYLVTGHMKLLSSEASQVYTDRYAKRDDRASGKKSERGE